MRAWLARHLQTLVGSLGRIVEQPVANTLTALVIGIALALPACLHVLVANAEGASADWARSIDVSVYLKTGVTAEQATQVAERIRLRRDVGEVRLIDADSALTEFREYSGFGAALDALTENPLPHALIVRPAADFAAIAHVESMAEELRQVPEVELVQLDTAWVARLHAILDTVRRGALLAGILLGIGVAIIVGNTIRLDIENRRDEIEVTKLVGGSDAFVRRPFLYSGVWFGLGGGLIAWILVATVVAVLAGPVGRITGLYGSSFALSGLDLRAGLAVIAAGVALGWLGSFVAATRHLRKIEPA